MEEWTPFLEMTLYTSQIQYTPESWLLLSLFNPVDAVRVDLSFQTLLLSFTVAFK